MPSSSSASSASVHDACTAAVPSVPSPTAGQCGPSALRSAAVLCPTTSNLHVSMTPQNDLSPAPQVAWAMLDPAHHAVLANRSLRHKDSISADGGCLYKATGIRDGFLLRQSHDIGNLRLWVLPECTVCC